MSGQQDTVRTFSRGRQDARVTARRYRTGICGNSRFVVLWAAVVIIIGTELGCVDVTNARYGRWGLATDRAFTGGTACAGSSRYDGCVISCVSEPVTVHVHERRYPHSVGDRQGRSPGG